jgi:hypothetical protein
MGTHRGDYPRYRSPRQPITKGSGEATGRTVRGKPVHPADLGKAQRAWNALIQIYNLPDGYTRQGQYHTKGKWAGKRLYGRPVK